MDTLKLIIALYKKELADANELKLLYQAQLEQQQQRAQQLEEQLRERDEQLEEQLRERVQQLEAQLRERDEQIKELRQQIPKVVEE